VGEFGNVQANIDFLAIIAIAVAMLAFPSGIFEIA